MFEKIRYKRRVGEILNRQTANVNAHRKKIKQAEKRGEDRIEIAHMESLASFEYSQYQEDIDDLTTSYLRKKAHRLMVPMPDFEDEEMWYESDYIGKRLLTTKGCDKLLSDITRRERDSRDTWLPWVVTLTGLIAAATGLVAVLTK